MRRIPLVAATAVAILVTFSAPAYADGGANNVVIANNTADNSSLARDRLQVAYDASSTVGNDNIASAQSSNCVSCRTIAVAMQVVLVESSDVTDFHPGNVAAAANGGCVTCTTYAFAYQDIVQPGRIVYLSGAAQQHLADLRIRADAIANDTSLSFADMKAQLDSLFADVVTTVSQDMQAAGANGTSDVRETSKVA
jgi:hypothetical protein